MEVPQKPYANITKSFVHLAAQICFMKNCWNPSPMTAITGPCTRHYHPTLSIWLSVDPMSDKYPGVSPYAYCANNPVRLVDPDGREIWVGDYYYCDGNFYDKEGNIHIANSPFEEKVLQALNTLYGTQQGFELMNPLMGTDEVNVHIKENHKSYWGDVFASGGTEKANEGTIFWNPNGAELHTTDGWRTNPITDLGHEFSHAYDELVGYEYKVGICEGESTIEWQAVYRENLIRIELGVPLRTHYRTKIKHDYWYPSIRDFDTKVPDGPEMIKNGKPYFPNESLIKVKNN